MTTREVDFIARLWDLSPLIAISFGILSLLIFLTKIGLINFSVSEQPEKDGTKALKDRLHEVEREIIEIRLKLAKMEGAREAQQRRDNDGHS